MTGRGTQLVAGAVALLLALQAAGCGTRLRWHLVREPSDAVVIAALNEADEEDGTAGHAFAAHVPSIPAPGNLRPCCAFGADLRTQVGVLPIPLMAISNVIGPDDVGPHKYDGGLLAMNPGQDPSAGREWGERNGLVYTCRGGFVDIAHVRDYADWTVFLAAQAFRAQRDGGTLTLSDKGGTRRIVFHPVAAARLDAIGARGLAIATAQWLAVQMAVWHEIATWYGWSWFRAFPETASAFSPEDVYSDVVGARIAGGILDADGADTDTLFEANMNVWLRRVLERLGAQPAAVGRAAMFAVDGQWWDSRRRLPDKRLTLRRNLGIGPDLTPWLVADAGIDAAASALLDAHCGADVRPVVLRNPGDYRDLPLREVATLEIDVSPALVARGLPLPRPAATPVTQDDFASIVAAIAVENDERFGSGAAAPAPR